MLTGLARNIADANIPIPASVAQTSLVTRPAHKWSEPESDKNSQVSLIE